jgi:hypothetical protein
MQRASNRTLRPGASALLVGGVATLAFVMTVTAGSVEAPPLATPAGAASRAPVPATSQLATPTGIRSPHGSAATPRYPVGIASPTQPSGLAPTGTNAMPGYRLNYVNNFKGNSFPVGWDVFTGIPGGAPGGQFAATHVVVSGGLLRLNAWKDHKYQNRWVTGGLCQCGLTRTYGAYFVRSRVTGGGANEVQLLWPKTNTWPPEIDFNENGGSLTSTSSTVHWGASNHAIRRVLQMDMTAWHTWGVVWTPSSIKYIVDGRVWTSITLAAAITRVPMRLDLEQRTICSQHRQCPTAPVSMLVDWIVEYAPR